MQSYRYDGVQALRFIAAAMVVMVHSTFYTSERLIEGLPVWHNGQRGVAIFFVISGFVMVISARHYRGGRSDWWHFASRRIHRIVPLYWLATTAKLAIMLVMPAAVLHAALDVETVAKSYFFIPHRNIDGRVEPLLGVGWTLVFEMFFYVLFTIGLWTRKNIYLTVAPVLMVCTIAGFFRPESYPVWMFYFNPSALNFLLGMLIGSLTLKGHLLTKSIAFTALPVCLLYTFISPNYFDLPGILEVGVPSALIVASTVALEDRLARLISKPILMLGAASYAMYLFHPLSAPLGPTILGKLGIISAFGGVALAWLIGASVGVVIYLIVEPVLNRMVAPIFRGRPAKAGSTMRDHSFAASPSIASADTPL